MDAEGARLLRERMDQRQQLHWRTARAVQEGHQDADDPDYEYLVSCRDGIREYEPQPGRRYVKQLVNGRWETAYSR